VSSLSESAITVRIADVDKKETGTQLFLLVRGLMP